MAAYRLPRYRPARQFRSPYGRRNGRTGAVAGVAIGAALAAGAGAHAAVTPAHPHHAQAARAAAAVAGTGESAFWAAVLADLGAPVTTGNVSSLTDWAAREGPWGTVGQWNPLDTILPEPGSWAFNTFGGGLHVQSYPGASEGAQATAATIGVYPGITAALRSGGGLCGDSLAAEFSRWSGGGYREVC
jgi:hypothetical protein